MVATLYVVEPGARVEKEYGTLLVVKDDEVLMRVPLARVTYVVLVGRTGVTTPALLALLKQGVRLSWVNRQGELVGQLVPPLGKNVKLRKRQYLVTDDDALRVSVVQAIVYGKVRNSLVLMKRLRRRGRARSLGRIEKVTAVLKAVRETSSIDALRGLEGIAARTYFSMLKEALPDSFSFIKRTRRPPRDPVNALLSWGYTLLYAHIWTALEVVGLDPYVGFFHGEKYGRPALALDLAEEFRAPVVDSLVLTLLNKRMITEKDFETKGGGGCYLRPRGLRVFLKAFSNRVQTTVKHKMLGRSLSYQKIFEVQARYLAKVIMGERSEYSPFEWR